LVKRFRPLFAFQNYVHQHTSLARRVEFRISFAEKFCDHESNFV
jgi:hypothetical protein